MAAAILSAHSAGLRIGVRWQLNGELASHPPMEVIYGRWRLHDKDPHHLPGAQAAAYGLRSSQNGCLRGTFALYSDCKNFTPLRKNVYKMSST